VLLEPEPQLVGAGGVFSMLAIQTHNACTTLGPASITLVWSRTNTVCLSFIGRKLTGLADLLGSRSEQHAVQRLLRRSTHKLLLGISYLLVLSVRIIRRMVS
jgi:hypothetical protein